MKKIYIFITIIDIAAGIIDIGKGISSSNSDKIMVGIIFLILAFCIFLYGKRINDLNEIIDLQDKYIKEQDKVMLCILKELINENKGEGKNEQ